MPRLKQPQSISPLNTRVLDNFYYGGISPPQVANYSIIGTLLTAVAFFASRRYHVTKLGCKVQTAGVAGTTVRLGIYTDNGSCYPDKLVVDGGDVAVNSTGDKEATVDVYLSANKLYWLVIHASANVTIIGVQAYSELNIFGMNPTSLSAASGAYQGAPAYAALPETYYSGHGRYYGSHPSLAIYLSST